ncbi:MAG: S41 family peptidase, partial [Bacteroidota bacterium]
SKALPTKNKKNLRSIHWQHLGNGSFSNSNTFKSLRTNRRRVFKPSFGEVAIKAPIKKSVTSKEYQLSFRLSNIPIDDYYKANISYCWIDSTFETACYEIGDINHKNWNKYKVNFSIPAGANGSYIKIKLIGNGETLLDDINIEDIHVEKSIVKIDFEKIKKSENEFVYRIFKDINNSLYKNNLAKDNGNCYLRIYAEEKFKKDSTLFASTVKYEDVMLKNISPSLKIRLPIVLMGNRLNTFPLADQHLLNRLQDSLMIKRKFFKKKVLATRLSDIIILWSEIQHFYPNFSLENKFINWESVLDTALNNSLRDVNGSEHKNEIKRMLAHLNDSHVQVDIVENNTSYLIPLEIEFVENKVIVKRLLSDFRTIQTGNEIIMINGDSIIDLIEQESKLISSGNIKIKNERALDQVFNFNKNEIVFLKIRDSMGKVRDVLVKASVSSYEHDVLIEKLEETTSKKKISDEIFYLNFCKISYSEFEQAIPQLEVAKSIIVDTRGYPSESGDNFRKIISHFLEKDDTTKWMFTPHIERPDRKELFDRSRALGWGIKKTNSNFSDKAMYLLIDHKAQSYMESILGYFDVLSNATLVGSPTAGANGNVVYSSLPTGLYYRYTGMKVLKHDGSRLHGIGFLPDVEVRPTIQGIREGRDEVLEKAIELAKENKD